MKCLCVHCDPTAGIKCDIEVGESTGARKLELTRWWWEIHPDVLGCSITGDNGFYQSKQAAVRNARTWANRLGLRVARVFVYGDEPE